MSNHTNHPHELLAVFLGNWHAEGSAFGGEGQTPDNPRPNVTGWSSIHTARWYSGDRFILQDERANGPFDTLAVLGWDADAERYFARTIENHGSCRDYTLGVEGRTWTFSGGTERATYTFSEDGTRQDIGWEWKRNGHWLPLCERTAHRMG